MAMGQMTEMSQW